MHYHIQTAPIWDAYKDNSRCPLCTLLLAKEKKVVKSYLNENVMDEFFRQRSNSVGFCSTHLQQLYVGENKLGLALQLETRANYIHSNLLKNVPTNKKSAKKVADGIKSHCGCVICDELNEYIPRYYMTIAQMFDIEPEFPDLFRSAHHCVKHAAELMSFCEYAKKSTKTFLQSLTNSLTDDLIKTEKELRAFCNCFDYNNRSTPDPQTIPNASKILISHELKR